MNRQIVTALLAAAGLSLAGCNGALGGFTPLYATSAGPGLSRIEVRAPDGRTGYLLREELDDALARSRGEPPLYRLLLTIKEQRTPHGLRVDNVANRYELNLDVSYVLVDLSTSLAATRGVVRSNVTFDSADQAYAGIAANLDGEERAAADAAGRLRVALGAYFANPQADVTVAAATNQANDTLTLSDRLASQPVLSPSQKAGETQPDVLRIPEPPRP